MANSVDYRSSLFWFHAVCFHTKLVSSVRQLFAADDFSRGHFQMHFLLGALRANVPNLFQLLLFSPAEMFKKPLWQTVWNQIRLLL